MPEIFRFPPTRPFRVPSPPSLAAMPEECFAKEHIFIRSLGVSPSGNQLHVPRQNPPPPGCPVIFLRWRKHSWIPRLDLLFPGIAFLPAGFIRRVSSWRGFFHRLTYPVRRFKTIALWVSSRPQPTRLACALTAG